MGVRCIAEEGYTAAEGPAVYGGPGDVSIAAEGAVWDAADDLGDWRMKVLGGRGLKKLTL